MSRDTDILDVPLVGEPLGDPAGDLPGDLSGDLSEAPVVDEVAGPHIPSGRRGPRKPRKPVDPTILALWDEYQVTPTEEIRNRLAIHYSPLVKYVAGRIGVGLPNTVDGEDLVQLGMFGLFDAITKFDPSRGLKFETYAVNRIRGAVIDGLRDLDWVPRSVRSRIKNVERAVTVLEAELNRTPTEQEIADHLGLTVEQVQDILTQAAYTHVGTLDDSNSSSESEQVISVGDRLVDQRAPLPGEDIEAEEQKQDLAHAMATLPERDRMVIALYYYEGFTLADIGVVLGVTESRVCQLHAKAMMALKAKMAHHAEDDCGIAV